VLTAGVRLAAIALSLATLNDGATITAANSHLWLSLDFLLA